MPDPTPKKTADQDINVGYAALKGRCPRCGRVKLYKEQYFTVTSACDNCGLDFSGHEQGDGPAFVGILIIGTLAAMGAVILDMYLMPPLWLHAAIWIPFICGGSILCLRISKAALVAVQYQYRKEDFTKPDDQK